MIDLGLKEKWARAASSHYADAHKAPYNHRDYERFMTFLEQRVDPKVKRLPDITLYGIQKIPRLIEFINTGLSEIYQAETQERTSPNKETGTQKIVKSLEATLTADLK